MHQRRPIQILPRYEINQFDKPPQFSARERKHFFFLSPAIREKVRNAKGSINPIGLVLQYGYFKATGKFYLIEQFRTGDIRYIAKQLNMVLIQKFQSIYSDRSRLNHKKSILEILGYQPFKNETALFQQIIEGLVAKQISPRKIVLSVIDLLSDKKIEVPNYTTFADEITLQYQKFEDNLVERLAQHISSDDKQALDQLINKSPAMWNLSMTTMILLRKTSLAALT